MTPDSLFPPQSTVNSQTEEGKEKGVWAAKGGERGGVHVTEKNL